MKVRAIRHRKRKARCPTDRSSPWSKPSCKPYTAHIHKRTAWDTGHLLLSWSHFFHSLSPSEPVANWRNSALIEGPIFRPMNQNPLLDHSYGFLLICFLSGIQSILEQRLLASFLVPGKLNSIHFCFAKEPKGGHGDAVAPPFPSPFRGSLIVPEQDSLQKPEHTHGIPARISKRVGPKQGPVGQLPIPSSASSNKTLAVPKQGSLNMSWA